MDGLLGAGWRCISVLDLSGAALERARRRLGDAARFVQWIEADVSGDVQVPSVDVWHDRAVFHFLTEADARRRYVERMHEAVKPSGHVVIGAFALDGPEKCSGLPVVRHSDASLAKEFGSGFELVESIRDAHRTPAGGLQSFVFARFRRSS